MTFEEMKATDPALHQIEALVLTLNNKAIKEEIIWFDLWADLKPKIVTAIAPVNHTDPAAATRKMHCAMMHLSRLATNMV